MLPPPAPWKLFVFGAGVFEMRVPLFMLAVTAGRMVRWLILSVLVLQLGPGAADLVAHHAMPVVAVIGSLAVIGFVWWWIRKKRLGKLLEE
jgi:membrane protein DedA with SNARE-associated domain